MSYARTSNVHIRIFNFLMFVSILLIYFFIYNKFNCVLCIVFIFILYLKTITIYLKKQNYLDTLKYGFCTRYAVSNFTLDWPIWPIKTGCWKVYYFMGIQIFNLMPTDVTNMPLPLFKIKISDLNMIWIWCD